MGVHKSRTWIITRERVMDRSKDVLIKFEMPENVKYMTRFLENTKEDAIIFYNYFLDALIQITDAQIISSEHLYPHEVTNAVWFGRYLNNRSWEDCTIENYKKNKRFGY